MTEIATQQSSLSYPEGNRQYFMETARSNMDHYGPLPYEIGQLVIDHVVDPKTHHMAADIHKNYLDSGSSAKAFVVKAEGSDVEDIMTVSALAPITLPTVDAMPNHRPFDIDKRLEALRRAQGLNGHVQLKAADRDRGIAITTKAPGKDVIFGNNTVDPSNAHWKQLNRTLKGMRRRRIGFDANGGNIHWDVEKGFTIYDTHPASLRPKTWVKPAKVIARTKVDIARKKEFKERAASQGDLLI